MEIRRIFGENRLVARGCKILKLILTDRRVNIIHFISRVTVDWNIPYHLIFPKYYIVFAYFSCNNVVYVIVEHFLIHKIYLILIEFNELGLSMIIVTVNLLTRQLMMTCEYFKRNDIFIRGYSWLLIIR